MPQDSNTARPFSPPSGRRRNFESVRGILQTALKRYGLDKEIAKYQFVQHWEEIVGADIAKRARPECIRNKTLIVRVTNSIWAQELSFQKQVILHRLKKFMGEDQLVADLLFLVDG